MDANQKKTESQEKLIQQREKDMLIAKESLISCDIIQAMDHLEYVMKACGLGSVGFHEVNSDMIRIQTRAPLTARLYPFLPAEDERNILVTKAIINIVIGGYQDVITGIRFHPAETGMFVIATLRKGKA